MKKILWKHRLPNKKKLLVLIILVVFLVLSSRSSTCCTGTSEITKACLFIDSTPIEGAEVLLLEEEILQYTDAYGETTFLGLEAGTYTIYVDIDGDGAWDGDPDTVVLGSGESAYVTNWFPLPLVQQVEDEN